MAMVSITNYFNFTWEDHMRASATLIAAMLFASTCLSTTYIVSKNGGGQFTSINAGINAASTNDTVLVLPGVYKENVNLNKNIVLMGSGFENTVILTDSGYSITMSNGKLLWFRVTALSGTGILLSGGIVSNVVVMGCSGNGILSNSGAGIVNNSVAINNGNTGIGANSPGYLTVTNCISRSNSSYGFYGGGYQAYRIALAYSNGSQYYTAGNQGCVDNNPNFVAPPYDLHIPSTSSGWDTGNPSLYDPDGSPSDMGYFGGPDCPVFPIVKDMTMSISGGNVQISVTGKANY